MNIVVGYIMTPQGKAAIDHAIAEARLRNAHLIVVNSMTGDEEDEQIIRYRDDLEEIDNRLTEEGIPHTIRELIRGLSPAEDLIRVSNEADAALLVIGLRRRTRTGKLLMGSNAHQILMEAECPVLAVKVTDPLG